MPTSEHVASKLSVSNFSTLVEVERGVAFTGRHDASRAEKFFYGRGGAALLAGSCEVLIFHPFDTAAKRLMRHRNQVVIPGNINLTLTNAENVVFGAMWKEMRGRHELTGVYPTTVAQLARNKATMWARLKHLYPGSVYAVYYKVLQRCVKFAGQPYVKDFLDSNSFKSRSVALCGERKAKSLMEGTAGAMVGVIELCLLPFDRMKVLSQTNISAIKGRSMFKVIQQEGISKMYVGAGATCARNVVGSFLLFGGTGLTKEYFYGLDDYRKATFTQNMVSSAVGASLGVIATSPMDVIKTRCQSYGFVNGKSPSGTKIFMDTIRTEGFNAFFKGVIPKLGIAAPKLIFCYTMTQFFLGLFERHPK